MCSGPSWVLGFLARRARPPVGAWASPRSAAQTGSPFERGHAQPAESYRPISLHEAAQSSEPASGKGDERGIWATPTAGRSGVSGDDSGGRIMSVRGAGGGEWLLPVTPADLRKRCAGAWGRNTNSAF